MSPVVFTTLVLITGPIWAKPVWGTYWQWDARLTSALVLWLTAPRAQDEAPPRPLPPVRQTASAVEPRSAAP